MKLDLRLFIKTVLDVDFKNSIVTIIIYLAEKYNLKIPNIVKYSKDRENILKQINSDRMTAKKVINFNFKWRIFRKIS